MNGSVGGVASGGRDSNSKREMTLTGAEGNTVQGAPSSADKAATKSSTKTEEMCLLMFAALSSIASFFWSLGLIEPDLQARRAATESPWK